jgi:hypothetical protein
VAVGPPLTLPYRCVALAMLAHARTCPLPTTNRPAAMKARRADGLLDGRHPCDPPGDHDQHVK